MLAEASSEARCRIASGCVLYKNVNAKNLDKLSHEAPNKNAALYVKIPLNSETFSKLFEFHHAAVMCAKSAQIVKNALKKCYFKKVFIKNSQNILHFLLKCIIITNSKEIIFLQQNVNVSKKK